MAIVTDHDVSLQVCLYILLCIMMMTAFWRGVRGWTKNRENVPWVRHAWGNGSGIWVLIFTVSLVLLAPFLIPKGIIPFASWEGWQALSAIGLVIAPLLCAVFSRLLGVWLGFRWRQSIG